MTATSNGRAKLRRAFRRAGLLLSTVYLIAILAFLLGFSHSGFKGFITLDWIMFFVIPPIFIYGVMALAGLLAGLTRRH